MVDFTRFDERRPVTKTNRRHIFLLVLWAALVPSLLRVREVMPPDEPRFTEQAQEMKEDRDLIVPKIGGITSPDKPPGLFWAINLASLLLPRVTELTARIPSALASLVVVLLTLRLGRRLFESEEIGLAGAMILLTGGEFFIKSQWVSCDMLLTAGVFIALTCFREALFEKERMLLLGWCAAGAAVLTKGPVGLLWPLLWVACEAAVRHRWRETLRLLHLPGISAFVFLVGGWYYAFGARAGWANLYNAIFTQNVTRYVSAWNAVNPWYFYLYQTPVDLLPWSFFLPAMLALMVFQVRRDQGACNPVAVRASALFALIAAAFFSGSTGKRGVYLLQIFPVISLLIGGAYLTAGRPGAIRKSWRSGGLAGMIALGLAIALGIPAALKSGKLATLAPGLEGWETLTLAIGGLSLAVGATVALQLARRGRPDTALSSAVAGIAVMLFLAGFLGGKAWNRNQGAREFGRSVAALVPSSERIAVERGKFEQILFYSERKGREFETEQQLVQALGNGRCTYAILEKGKSREFSDHEPFRRMPLLLTARVAGSTFSLLGPAESKASPPQPPSH
jgi:4-amino-4-deoxy-L-arabinose transferase-like glycosyltransferase